MKANRITTHLIMPALLVAGYFLTPVVITASETGDSPEITKLLGDAKAEAFELRHDAEGLDAFAKSRVSWQSYAVKIEMVKEHVNNTGKLLARLNSAETSGAPWQQTAIQQIEPLLKELAVNTESTIDHLNEHQSQIHFPEFKDYVKANYKLATDLEALIRDFVDYGGAKDKIERLEQKLDVTE